MATVKSLIQKGKAALSSFNEFIGLGDVEATVGGGNGAQASNYMYGGRSPVFPVVFDGEVNSGEAGPIYQYFMDYGALRLRSRQLYVESEICKAAVDKSVKWVIGAGLKLQCEPQKEVLEQEGISLPDTEKFNTALEARWKVYAASKTADITGRRTLHQLTGAAYHERTLVGDILVVLSVKGMDTVKVRHIDAANVMTPPTFFFNGTDYIAEGTGNRVRQGVEIDSNGKHVAYYVRKDDLCMDFHRVPTRGKKSGMLMAYLCTAQLFSEDSERGMSLLMTVMETAKKLGRYTSAALAGAEARQKVAFAIEHDQHSDNEDPLIARRAKQLSGRGVKDDVARTVEGDAKAKQVYAMTNTTTINMPNGAKLKSLDSTQETKVDEFGNFNIDLIAAAVCIPPDVIMSKYENSFSASRMSGKDWEHTFTNRRKEFAEQYLGPIKSLQTFLWILTSKIDAPGYLAALRDDNEMAIAAYNHCRWVGDMFPDIDPLKTVNYLRSALGTSLAHVPLMTPEAAAEHLGQGDISAIITQTGDDLKDAKKAGLEPKIDDHKKKPNDSNGDGNPPGDGGSNDLIED